MSLKEQSLSKNDSKLEKTKISICDLFQNNTSEILQKMEYQVPVYLQGYSDLFTKYLHSFNTLFGTCRMSEKQFFDKLGVDHFVLQEIVDYWNFLKNLSLIQIELNSKFVEDYIEFRVSTIESFDKSLTSIFDYYTKTLSEFNKK
ncbi:hypothetical protein [Candidatus Nitrosarchaeum limnium]|jgi:hypothetical protein|uniref:Uncharacterized protein n=1 Tax=Candidatus Nitrosarchaeum limnium BG20 TaxID=859192 RepID=S2EKU2_9ARCH|nr:hypothetical protein [Candidatus Nitrosarchaeum limnium]EPA05257.1 hypothetical protein BG20_I1331 [Candidatus Nitrosarchaeum limnium BG20]